MMDVLDAYNQLAQEYKLPELKAAKLKVQCEKVTADVCSLIKAFAPNSGWICFQSEVISFVDGKVPDGAGHGLVISAELENGATSLHLRPDGAGGWSLITLTENEGGDCMMEETSHLAIKNELQNLRYRLYWRAEEISDKEWRDVSIRPWQARFIGFGGNAK